MFRARSIVWSAVALPVMERLEERQLMARFAPIIHETPLVSDNAQIAAARNDANLVNPIGITPGAGDSFWIAVNGNGNATVYNSAGAAQPSAASPTLIGVPGPVGSPASSPTGIVRHTGAGFAISAGTAAAPSAYLFATNGGIIAGWNGAINAAHAVTAIDHSSSGDVFKGLAIIGSGQGARIYATDFYNGRIEEFNSRFQPVALNAKAFKDIEVPAGYAPFGIQALHNKLYVSYARQDAAGATDNPGPAQGIVDMYNASGKLLKRVGTGGDLNSPWGMAIAPPGWGVYQGDLLVGNEGDGTIAIFDRKNNFVGQVIDPASLAGAPLVIDGLWGLTTGVGKSGKTVFFTAGPNLQADGLFGTLVATKRRK